MLPLFVFRNPVSGVRHMRTSAHRNICLERVPRFTAIRSHVLDPVHLLIPKRHYIFPSDLNS